MSIQARELLDKLPPTQRLLPIVVVTANPFVVSIDGSNVPGKPLDGSNLRVGDVGFAIWHPPLPPLCFSTSLFGDTGWVDVSYASGFASGTGGQLQYRRQGAEVIIRGGADHTTNFTNGQLVATLPTGARPSTQQRFMAFGSNRRAVAVDIQVDGQILAGWPDPPGTGGTSNIHDPWPTSWVGLDHRFFIN